MLDYLRATPGVRDVVVSGGDVANLPFKNLEAFVAGLLEIESVRDIRLATKAPWDAAALAAGRRRGGHDLARHDCPVPGVSLAIHTHVNAAQSVTPLVAEAAQTMLAVGVRDVRNQGVLLKGVNDSAAQLLDLCFALLDGASITPYYFYMCDMIPSAEHWRVSLAQAQTLQHDIMGYLPGFATPRIVCDVPTSASGGAPGRRVRPRARHQLLDEELPDRIERTDEAALDRRYTYYDPIETLPASGQAWWAERGTTGGRGAEGRERRAPRPPPTCWAESLPLPTCPPPVAGSSSTVWGTTGTVLVTDRLRLRAGRSAADRPPRRPVRPARGHPLARRWPLGLPAELVAPLGGAAHRGSAAGRSSARIAWSRARCCSSRCPTGSARWRSAGTCTPTPGAADTRPRRRGR